MRPLSIERGQRFGKLTVIRETEKIGVRRAFKLKCDCGQTCIVRLIALTRGQTVSCGCFGQAQLGNARRTHGRSNDPIYFVWQGMLQRCEDVNHKSYPNYGGRGIKVCKRWHQFENFLADMGERPSPKHEIDRIDNDGDYESGNVRWTDDRSSQMDNRQKQKRKKSSSRFKGVDWWNDRAWRARITVNGTVYELGLFDSERKAADAYNAARLKLRAT